MIGNVGNVISSPDLDHFLLCQEANGVSKESTCADNMKPHTAENYIRSYQTYVTEVVKDN
jgi:hypothetical protein